MKLIWSLKGNMSTQCWKHLTTAGTQQVTGRAKQLSLSQGRANPIHSAPAHRCCKGRRRAMAQLLVSKEKPVIQIFMWVSWFLNTSQIKTSKDRLSPWIASLWMPALEWSLKPETEEESSGYITEGLQLPKTVSLRRCTNCPEQCRDLVFLNSTH